MDQLLVPFAAQCPCCALIDEHELSQALSQRSSITALLRCKFCETELREKVADVSSSATAGGGKGSSKKGGSKASQAKGAGKGGKGGSDPSGGGGKANAIVEAARAASAINHSASFICMTCGFSCCGEHAMSHFLDSGKKRSKKGGTRHTEHHCVFYATKESEPAVNMFKAYCVACDIPIGNSTTPNDMDYHDCIDGYVINHAGYDISGEDYVTGAFITAAQAFEDAEDEEATGGKGGKGGRKKLKFGKNKRDTNENTNSNKRELRKAEKKERRARARASGNNNGGSDRSRNPEITEQGQVGLVNLGNTCFFNSTIQCFLQLKTLQNAFGCLMEDDLPGPMSLALRRTFALVESSPIGSVVAPRSLFSQVCGRNPMFAEYGQQDAEELYNCITNACIDEYEIKHGKKRLNENNGRNTDAVEDETNSHVFNRFGAEMNIAITCHECKTVSQLQEDLLGFSLSINGCHSVVDAMRKFFLPLLMTGSDAYLCEKCCHEEFLAKKRAEEAEKRQREEMTRRMMDEMKSSGGLAQDEILDGGNDDEDENDSSSSSSDDEEDEENDEEEENEDQSKSAKLDQRTKGVTTTSASSTAEISTSSEPKKQEKDEKDGQSKRQQQNNKDDNNKDDDDGNKNTSTNNDRTSEQPHQQPQASPSQSPSRTTKKYCDATSESTLNSVRDVIVIQLKRFSVDWKRGCYVKDNSHIAFTSEIDLSEFAPKLVQKQQETETDLALLMSAFPQRSPEALQYVLDAAGGSAETAMALIQEGDFDLGTNRSASASASKSITGDVSNQQQSSSSSSLKYRLCGVVEHSGSCDGGHYVSYTKSARTGQWYYQSDSWVKVSSESEALRAQAYMLYYEKI